jgi:hypothetical protein
VVFKEIMYHPPDLPGRVDNAQDEYLLLQNVTSSAVSLFDPAFPTNTCRVRGGVDFDFPANVILAPGGSLVLVSFDVTNAASLDAFRARYGQLAAVPAYGPYAGKLDNGGESVELYKPDTPDTNGVPYVLVEQISYKDFSPWPPGPDGSGSALQRVTLTAYGNDPANWISAAPLTITLQPQSLALSNSMTATFTVAAFGAGPVRYQWRYNGVDILGATNPTLIVLNVGPTNAGTYTVFVSDDLGSALSQPATLQVLSRPLITLQPQPQTVAAAGDAIFTVTSIGTQPIGHRWRRQGATITPTNLPNAFATFTPTSSVLTLTNVQLTNAGSYSVVASNLVGQTGASSNAILVVVRPPADQTVPLGTNVTLRAVVGVPPNFTQKFFWQFHGDDILAGAHTNSSGAALAFTNDLVLTNLTESQSGSYAFLLWNPVLVTNTIVITNPPPAVTNVVITTNFIGAPATFSALVSLISQDTDGDGLPDNWEKAHGLKFDDPSDADADADGDRMSNREEYLAGTDPQDGQSYLRIDASANGTDRGVVLSFVAASNKTYTILCRDVLPVAPWVSLTNLTAVPTNRTVLVTDSPPQTHERYYRLVTPKQP